MSEEVVISMQDLTKIYGHTPVVDRLNLQVPAHQITAFLGRNGAGKSTTIKMRWGSLIRPQAREWFWESRFSTRLGAGKLDAR